LGWLFHPGPVELMEMANERGKAGLMVFAVKPLLVPPLEGRFQREIKDVAMQASLDANTTNDFVFCYTRLIFQKEIMLE
jgi:hypothetical protein